MWQKLWGIIVNSFTETIRQPIYLVIVLTAVHLAWLNVFVAGYTLDDDNKLLKDLGLSTLLLAGLFLAAFSAAGIISQEIENKTVLTVVSKPVGRPLFMLGKFLGLSAALAIAMYVLGIQFLFTMRHKVMERSSQHLDLPVLLSSFAAFYGAVLIAAFCNYMYDMQFTSTVVILWLPLTTLALLLVALIGPEWQFQSFGAGFIDGQILAAIVLVFAMVMVLTAVAVAASSRLGQIMTLTLCTGFLLIGLVSDTLFGQHSAAKVWAKVAYWISPNLAYLWVTDALTQGTHLTADYVLSSLLYAGLLVVGWLFVGITLFQKREVG